MRHGFKSKHFKVNGSTLCVCVGGDPAIFCLTLKWGSTLKEKNLHP